MDGFTEEGLAGFRTSLKAHVDGGDVPGLVALIARGRDVHVEAFGSLAVDDPAPLGRDAIFRIASLSKPLGAAGAMVLVDEGVLALDDPVEKFLPELGRPARPPESWEPARRHGARNALDHGGGPVDLSPGLRQLSWPFRAPIRSSTKKRGSGWRPSTPPWPPPQFERDEWIARFATLPLMAQPGQAWHYNTGAELLGFLIERATGRAPRGLPARAVVRPAGHARHLLQRPARQGVAVHHRLRTISLERAARRPGSAGHRMVECTTGPGQRGRHAGVHGRRPLGLRVHAGGRRGAWRPAAPLGRRRWRP